MLFFDNHRRWDCYGAICDLDRERPRNRDADRATCLDASRLTCLRTRGGGEVVVVPAWRFENGWGGPQAARITPSRKKYFLHAPVQAPELSDTPAHSKAPRRM